MSIDRIKPMFTIIDLVIEWKESREIYARQIIFFEHGPGRNPVTRVETLRRWIVELDCLIAEYESPDT